MIALAAILALAQDVEHDPRSRPTFLRHALFTLEGVTGRVATIGDLDGDEVSELVARKDGQLVVFEGGTGETLRPFAEVMSWHVGDDLDRDGVRDIALKPRDPSPSDSGSTRIEVRSGRTGDVLHGLTGAAEEPWCYAWVGDVDGDGLRDLAYCDRAEPDVVVLSASTWDEVWRAKLDGDGGRPVGIVAGEDRSGDRVDDVWVALQDDEFRMSSRLLSGRDGAPLEASEEPKADRAIGDIDGDGVDDIAWSDAVFAFPNDESLDAFANRSLAEALQRTLASGAGGDGSKATPGRAWVTSGATGDPIVGVWGEPGSESRVGRQVYGLDDQDFDGWRDIGVYSEIGLHVVSTGRPEVRSDDPFDWLPGRWVSRSRRGGQVVVSEEIWLEPAGGRMLGVTRSFVPGSDRGGSFEFLRIEREGARLVLLAQPGGTPPTRFAEAERGRAHVLFTNPEHDFPTRILYRRTRDELSAEVGTDDDPAAVRLRWKLSPRR